MIPQPDESWCGARSWRVGHAIVAAFVVLDETGSPEYIQWCVTHRSMMGIALIDRITARTLLDRAMLERRILALESIRERGTARDPRWVDGELEHGLLSIERWYRLRRRMLEMHDQLLGGDLPSNDELQILQTDTAEIIDDLDISLCRIEELYDQIDESS